MTSRKFTTDELRNTKNVIKQLLKDLKFKEAELIAADKDFSKLIDPTLVRGVGHKTNTVNLFEIDDIEMLGEIVVWNGQDVYDEKSTNEENDHE